MITTFSICYAENSGWKLNHLAENISMQSIYPLTLTKGHNFTLEENLALLVKHAIVYSTTVAVIYAT